MLSKQYTLTCHLPDHPSYSLVKKGLRIWRAFIWRHINFFSFLWKYMLTYDFGQSLSWMRGRRTEIFLIFFYDFLQKFCLVGLSIIPLSTHISNFIKLAFTYTEKMKSSVHDASRSTLRCLINFFYRTNIYVIYTVGLRIWRAFIWRHIIFFSFLWKYMLTYNFGQSLSWMRGRRTKIFLIFFYRADIWKICRRYKTIRSACYLEFNHITISEKIAWF